MKSRFKAQVIVVLAAVWFLGRPPLAAAQDEKDTPSQKTKEAVEKFKKAPATVGESLEALQKAAKAKLEGTLAPKKAEAKTKADEPGLPKVSEPVGPPRYSPAGKRDPFRPLAQKSQGAGSRPRENLSPLERFELGQLRLVGIVWDIQEPRAMVEDSLGLGYIVKVGTPIGPNEGKVKEIKPREVVIEEVQVDFFGARKPREVSMTLPAE
ncbi:MAG: pilus assembly protein PilP [Deltaproteobacteria bacterium]|nr:pilus assembly protein PilP [Deltaproteobacteria bacterium]